MYDMFDSKKLRCFKVPGITVSIIFIAVEAFGIEDLNNRFLRCFLGKNSTSNKLKIGF